MPRQKTNKSKATTPTTAAVKSPIHVESKYWTISVAMQFLACSQQTITNLRKRDLPHVLIPGAGKQHVLFERAKLVRWAKANKRISYPKIADSLHAQQVAAAAA